MKLLTLHPNFFLASIMAHIRSNVILYLKFAHLCRVIIRILFYMIEVIRLIAILNNFGNQFHYWTIYQNIECIL